MCQFSLPFSGEPQSLLQRAKQSIENMGGVFNGDDRQGNFSTKTPIGSIKGSYQMLEGEIALNITKKPFLLSCNKIEKELRAVIR
jgi:hypothetical protein